MLFNKKPQDEFSTDFSSAFGSEPRPAAYSPKASEPMASAPPRKPAAGSASTRSVIDSWLTIRGDLESEGEVQVDGKVNGDIRCAHLVVGKDAIIVGNITAEEVIVRGKVNGIIRALSVTLQDTAVVQSEIYHKSLAVEQGACFDGHSRRRNDPMKADIVGLSGDKSRSKVNGLEHSPSAAA
jgi:cytoskeletal protein CcmA (bactofilin family)